MVTHGTIQAILFLSLVASRCTFADKESRRRLTRDKLYGKRTRGIPEKKEAKKKRKNKSSSGPTPKSCTEEQIIVVGAGASGLAAARDLQDRGCNVVVIEARDRIGGRSFTRYNEAAPFDFPIDVGGQFIHGSDNPNNLAWLARKFGIEMVIAGGDSAYLGFAEEALYKKDWNGDLFTDEEIESGFTLFDDWWDKVTELQYDTVIDKDLGDMPLKEASEYVMNDGMLGPLSLEDQSLLDYHIDVNFPSDWGMDTSKFALYGIDEGDGWWWCPVKGEDAVFPGGISQLWNLLAAGDTANPQNKPLDIRFNSVATKIKHDEKGCAVSYRKNGSTKIISGSVCICTVPLMVLNGIFQRKYTEGNIEFDPPLSAAKQMAIEGRGVSYLNQAYMVFATPFWRTIYPGKKKFQLMESRPNNCQRTLGTDFDFFTEFIEMNGYKQTDDYYMLSAFYGGDKVWMESLSNEALEEKFLAGLSAIFGEANVPTPLGFETSRWKEDPFARGAYTGIRTFSTDDDWYELAEPESNSLRFAGEHTNYDGRYQSLDGAYQTGTREAHIIAGLSWNSDVVSQVSEWMNPNDYCTSLDNIPNHDPPCEELKGKWKCKYRNSCQWNKLESACQDKASDSNSGRAVCESYATFKECKESGYCKYNKKKKTCSPVKCERLATKEKCEKKSSVCSYSTTENMCMDKN